MLAPAPCDRGFRLDNTRPPSSIGERVSRAAAAAAAVKDTPGNRRNKGKNKAQLNLRVHAHVREKVITIHAGAGEQRVYWLGATAVGRYLAQPQSYSTAFSLEMTPKAVIVEDGSVLERTTRVCDELSDGDHVWIDVGDGAPLSRVQSRAFPDRRLFEPSADDDFQEKIGWRATDPDMLDEEVIGIDPRHTMNYQRTVLKKQPTYKEWQGVQPATGQEGLFDEYMQREWPKVQLDDMSGSSSWMNDLKLTLFQHYEAVKYVFHSHASVTPDGDARMSLIEFWAFCKRCALPTPWCNLAKINQIFVPKGSDKDAHNPQHQLKLADFMGALARVSVLRQKKVEEALPSCLITILEENVLKLTPGFSTFDTTRATASPFTAPAVRQKLTVHETKLKKLFRKWSTADEARQTINLTEWIDMFAASSLIGADLDQERLTEAFVVAQLGDHAGAFEHWLEAGESACRELIFPEFVEAILRAALMKFSLDEATPVDLKIHEMCLLLIFGPAGLHNAPPPRPLLPPPLAGVERRAGVP